jgi:histidinol dehydrogenase
MDDENVAFNLLNEYAAEHLIIASDNAIELSENFDFVYHHFWNQLQ